MEEDITKNVEFPLAGKFVDIRYGKFKCCGEPNLTATNASVEQPPPQSVQPPQPWSLPRPWTNNSIAGSSSALLPRKKVNQPMEAFFKRSIPFVALCLDRGRNITVESTINNVYVKIPENVVSVESILSAMATKLSCEATDLIMLDVKFIEISDDKGLCCQYTYYISITLLCVVCIDLEYWKVPSRRFYVCKREEYNDVMKVRSRKRLSLKKKRIPAGDTPISDEEDSGLNRLENKISKVVI